VNREDAEERSFRYPGSGPVPPADGIIDTARSVVSRIGSIRSAGAPADHGSSALRRLASMRSGPVPPAEGIVANLRSAVSHRFDALEGWAGPGPDDHEEASQLLVALGRGRRLPRLELSRLEKWRKFAEQPNGRLAQREPDRDISTGLSRRAEGR